jgi:hypothetical protein
MNKECLEKEASLVSPSFRLLESISEKGNDEKRALNKNLDIVPLQIWDVTVFVNSPDESDFRPIESFPDVAPDILATHIFFMEIITNKLDSLLSKFITPGIHLLTSLNETR